MIFESIRPFFIALVPWAQLQMLIKDLSNRVTAFIALNGLHGFTLQVCFNCTSPKVPQMKIVSKAH